MTEPQFTIGEVAAMLGLSAHTIRAWERRYLVVRPTRTPSGQRRYGEEDVEILRQVKHERHVHGLSMRVATMAVRGELSVDVEGSDHPREDVAAASLDWDESLRLAPDLVSEVIVVLDGDGRIGSANVPFVRFFDVLPARLRGVRFVDLVDPFDRAKAVQVYRAPLRRLRGWELNLRSRREQALFSFDCWPLRSPERAGTLLVGRRLEAARGRWDKADGGGRPAIEGPRSAGSEVVERLRPLLDHVADPLSMLCLFRRWLDSTTMGVALLRCDAELTVVHSNPTLRRWNAGDAPAAGRPWSSVGVGVDADAVRSAVADVVRSRQPRRLPAARTASDIATDGPVRDVELWPVTGVEGAVTHVLALIADVTAETATWRRLGRLASCAALLRDGMRPDVLAPLARHIEGLLPNSGALLAVAGEPGGGPDVIAATGVWSRAQGGGGERGEERLGIVLQALSAQASVEVEWDQDGCDPGIARIVPILSGRRRGRRGLGVVAFARPGGGVFSVDERRLIDEFARRVGVAIERAPSTADRLASVG